ncbi:MAG: hypothetical protein JSU96_16565 [Acidobacteriota bacterium]|nr:MAG: hypothetical protein JSU96_16565 [Acidobacteriota bacterium]
MWTHLIAILCITVCCIVFGLLRAELDSEETKGTACESCDQAGSCGHFCVRRPMTSLSKVLGLKK